MMETTERMPANPTAGRNIEQEADYDRARQRHLRAFIEQAPGEVEKLSQPLADLHAVRDARLRALIRVAKEHSPWHARRLRHIDPDTVRGDDLSAIPPMTKADLMANWNEIVTDRRLNLNLVNRHLAHVAAHGPAYLLDEYHVVAGGGSTGRRGVFVWDFAGWLQSQLVLARHVGWLSRRLGPPRLGRIASVLAANSTHMSGAMMRTFAGQVGSNFALSVTLPLSEIVAELNAYQPDTLYSYPSLLHRLAGEAREGRLRIAPRALAVAAEPLLPGARQAIAAAFGVPLLNCYACSEGGLIAWSYPDTAGLHLVEDIAVYEPVDVVNRAVPTGTPSAKVLLTNVINQTLPLIRYELTDELSVLAEPNPDPWTGRRISEVQGRLDDHFRYAGGVEVHPHVFRSALAGIPEVTEYQVCQTARGAGIVVQAAGAPDLRPARETIGAALVRLGLSDPEITISTVARLDGHAGTGKVRRFVPQAV
jgi:phenylacetate-CoA ligase